MNNASLSRLSGQTLRLLAPTLLGLALLGCSSTKNTSIAPPYSPDSARAQAIAAASSAAPADAVEQADAPAPALDAQGQPIEQVGMVRPGLNLRITVLVAGQPEFDEPSRQVSAQGELDVPLIGKVQVSGLTLEQIEYKLTQLYTQYLIQPQVVVEYVQREGSSISPWGYVTVLGRVRAPGKFPIPATRDLTVSAAIQQAGGYDTSARASSIRVTRQLSDNTTQRIKVDLKAYGKGDLEEDIILKAGDVVFVPESLW